MQRMIFWDTELTPPKALLSLSLSLELAQSHPLSGSLLRSHTYSTPPQPRPSGSPHGSIQSTSYTHSSKLNNTIRKQRDKFRKWDFLWDGWKNRQQINSMKNKQQAVL